MIVVLVVDALLASCLLAWFIVHTPPPFPIFKYYSLESKSTVCTSTWYGRSVFGCFPRHNLKFQQDRRGLQIILVLF